MADEMKKTTEILSPGDWEKYFDDFSRDQLRHTPEAVTIEVLSPLIGDQIAADSRLLGLTFDPKSRALEVIIEGSDHMVFYPVEIAVLRNADGLISTIQLV